MQKLQIIWIEPIVRLRTSSKTPNMCVSVRVSTCILLSQMWSSDSLFWSGIGSYSPEGNAILPHLCCREENIVVILRSSSPSFVVSLSFDRRESTDVATTMKWVSLKLKFANAFELKKLKKTKKNENEPECLLAQSADIAHTICDRCLWKWRSCSKLLLHLYICVVYTHKERCETKFQHFVVLFPHTMSSVMVQLKHKIAWTVGLCAVCCAGIQFHRWMCVAFSWRMIPLHCLVFLYLNYNEKQNDTLEGRRYFLCASLSFAIRRSLLAKFINPCFGSFWRVAFIRIENSNNNKIV